MREPRKVIRVMGIKKNSVIFKKNKDFWYVFEDPVEIFVEYGNTSIKEKLREIEALTDKGCFAAGFLSYESSKAFDNKFQVKENKISPDLWFGIYEKRKIVSHNDLFKEKSPCTKLSWNSSVTKDEYADAIKFTKDKIKKGDIYQLNYTFMMDAEFKFDPFSFFSSSFANLDSDYLSFIDTDDFSVLCGSPELFFHLKDEKIISKPMKGTFPRGRSKKEDDLNRLNLFFSKKDRAENLMIVDMIRNDFGKIAESSSVKVEKLHEIEQYSRVLQMTSSVEAITKKSVCDVFGAMFPCASITGAPKIKSMEHINEIEKNERGLYTGAIGYITPEKEALFNVAIRTVFFNKEKQKAFYGTGGGIVWDSVTENEYEECKNKALIISNPEVEFKLLETLLYEPEKGIFLKDYHIKRMRESAEYFSIDLKRKEIEEKLSSIKSDNFLRVRLLCDNFANLEMETFDLGENQIKDKTRWKVGLSRKPVDSKNRFLFHKTTNRWFYDEILRSNPGFNDMILFNEKGEITESCFANILLKKDGKFYTPPLESGLLNGTMRSYLIDKGEVFERKILKEELFLFDEILLINSLRGFIEIDFADC